MTTKYLVLVAYVAVLACTAVFGQAAAPPSKQESWPCGTTSNLLVDSDGQTVWIDSEELRRHAIYMPGPKLPSSLRAAGKVTIDVLVDTTVM